MNALLGAKERENLFKFAKAVAITQTKSAAGLSMLMQLSQGGIIMNVATGKEGMVRKGAAILMAPGIMAKLMTNPTMVKLMTSAANTPAWAKQSPVISTKILEAYEEAKAESEGKDTPTEALTEYTTRIGQ